MEGMDKAPGGNGMEWNGRNGMEWKEGHGRDNLEPGVAARRVVSGESTASSAAGRTLTRTT